MRKFFSVITIFSAACSLHAELIWDQNSGWRTEPGDGLTIKSEDFTARELMNEARIAQEDGKFSTAIAKYVKVHRQYGNSIFAPEAYYQIGKIRVQKRQYKAAFKAFDTVIQKYPQYPGFRKVLHEQFNLASMVKGGARPYYFGVIPGFKDRNSAIEYYENVVRSAPFDDLAPSALKNIAELYLRDKKPADAINTLERLIDTYPDSEYTPGAYLRIAKIYSDLVKSVNHDQGAIKEAVHCYEDFLILYPTDERVPEVEANLDTMKTLLAKSKISVGDFYFNSRNNPKAAIIMYKEAITCYPGSAIARVAQDRIQYILDGNDPKRTPVDFFFGRYKRPSDEQWVSDATLAEVANEEFEDNSEAVLNYKNQSVQSLSNSDQGEVNTDFNKINQGADEINTSDDAKKLEEILGDEASSQSDDKASIRHSPVYSNEPDEDGSIQEKNASEDDE